MNRRKKVIENLESAIREHKWEQCTEYLFMALYGLPVMFQIGAACFMIERYMPIFREHYPRIRWTGKLLNDIGEYVNKHGRRIPDPPKGCKLSDTEFVFCFDALVLAYYHRKIPAILSVSCACAADSAIGARFLNAWIADEPEGFKMWERGELIIGHGLSELENVASNAVREREWGILKEWLCEKKIWEYPDDNDLSRMEKTLVYWKELEMSLIVPETHKLLEKEKDDTQISIWDLL